MKETINEFWSMVISDNPEMQMEGSLKWAEFASNNPNYFSSLKDHLTSPFCDLYEKVNFHDFQLHNISSFSKDLCKKTKINLLLFDYHEDYDKNLYFSIVYEDVKEYSIIVKPTEFYLTWDGDIFELLNDNLLRHRILCHDGSYLEISFKNISVTKEYK